MKKVNIKTIIIRSLLIILITVAILVGIGLRYLVSQFQNVPFYGVFIESLVNKDYQKPTLPDNFSQELKKTVIPLKSVEPKNDLSELDALRPFFQGKRIIGMGEATHGTKEFFKMKHKTFEYLVKNLGYKIFIIEGSFSAAVSINNYVMYGKGNKYDALDSMKFWVWNTEEVIDLIDWMHAYNIGKPDEEKVKFYGFDMQLVSPAAKELNAYIENALPEKLDEFSEYTKPFANNLMDFFSIEEQNAMDKKLSELKGNMKSADDLLKNNMDSLIKVAGEREYRIAKNHVDNIKNTLIMLTDLGDFTKYFNSRDKAMADNVKFIMELEGADSKALLWGHNTHISTQDDVFETMGENLRKFYDEEYSSIGFSFSEGSFKVRKGPESALGIIKYFVRSALGYEDNWPVSDVYLDKIKYSHLTNFFSEIQTPIFFLDMKKANENKALYEIFNRKYLFYNAGATYNGPYSCIEKINLSKQFDAIIYIEKTSASRVLK